MAEDFWPANSADCMTDTRTQNIVDECKRQEESCLYTSTSLLEWLKRLRVWKALFIITPIILGGVATWPLLAHHDEYKWFTGVCALLAGFSPALYKALDFDVSLKVIAQHAHEFKILQDRFRQAWRIEALGPFPEFKKEFDDLMAAWTLRVLPVLLPRSAFSRRPRRRLGEATTILVLTQKAHDNKSLRLSAKHQEFLTMAQYF